jgi:hypothetical protein
MPKKYPRCCHLVLLIVFTILETGCTEQPSSRVIDTRILATKDRDKLDAILKGLGNTASLTLYEGLPHQDWDYDQYASELATKETVEFQEYPFYKAPLVAAASDVERLRELSLQADSYASNVALKMCGSYHPDYCLVWKDGAKTGEILICFGCGEALFFSANKRLLVDMRVDVERELKAVLQQYRGQRPSPEH